MNDYKFSFVNKNTIRIREDTETKKEVNVFEIYKEEILGTDNENSDVNTQLVIIMPKVKEVLGDLELTSKQMRKIRKLTKDYITTLVAVEDDSTQKILRETVNTLSLLAKYDGEKFTSDIINDEAFDPAKISLTIRGRKTDFTQNLTSLENKKGSIDTAIYDSIHNILTALIQLVDKGEVVGSVNYFQGFISDSTINLMENTPYFNLGEREAIYAFWEERYNEYNELKKLYDEIIELSEKKGGKKLLNEDALEHFKTTGNLVFKEDNNYVIQVDPVEIIDTDAETKALQLITAFLKRNGASEIVEGLLDEANWEGEGKTTDVLTALYFDSFFGGAFFDGDVTLMQEVIDILEDYEEEIVSEENKDKLTYQGMADKYKEMGDEIKAHYFAKDDLEDLVNMVDILNKFMSTKEEDGSEIPAKEIYLPSMIFTKAYLDKNYPNNKVNYLNPANHQDTYTDLIERTVGLIVSGRLSKDGRLAGRHTPKASARKDGQSENYSESWVGSKIEFKTLKNKMGKAIHEFITLLTSYVGSPMATPTLGLGVEFGFKDSSIYGTLLHFAAKEQLLEDKENGKTTYSPTQVNLLTRGILEEQYDNQSGTLFTTKSLMIIKDFLDELNGNFNWVRLQNKSKKLIQAMITTIVTRQSEIPKEARTAIKENIKLEIHSFIDHIATSIGTKEDGQREKIAFFDKKTNIDDDIKSLADITSFSILKDFMVKYKDVLKNNRTTYDRIIKLIEVLSQENDMGLVLQNEIQKQLLEAHDGIRIIKGWPIHYGLKSIYSIEGVNNMKDELSKYYGVDLTAMDITAIVEDVDSYSNIAKQNGISEEKVYLIKANFR
tara:strand:- start:40 stop:2544 length:2505 start_codon:yes stop_codon:yes gene_type:complete